MALGLNVSLVILQAPSHTSIVFHVSLLVQKALLLTLLQNSVRVAKLGVLSATLLTKRNALNAPRNYILLPVNAWKVVLKDGGLISLELNASSIFNKV